MVQCRRPDGSVCRATAFAPWAKGFFWGLPKKENLTKKRETERERRKRKRGEVSQKTHDLLTGGHCFFLRQETCLWAGQFTFKTALCFPQIFVAERLLLHTTARADRQCVRDAIEYYFPPAATLPYPQDAASLFSLFLGKGCCSIGPLEAK